MERKRETVLGESENGKRRERERERKRGQINKNGQIQKERSETVRERWEKQK
jgi:hypothetical protein